MKMKVSKSLGAQALKLIPLIPPKNPKFASAVLSVSQAFQKGEECDIRDIMLVTKIADSMLNSDGEKKHVLQEVDSLIDTVLWEKEEESAQDKSREASTVLKATSPEKETRRTETTSFSNIPIEEDTKILKRQEVNVSGKPALYEKWFWDGIYAESLIFIAKDIENMSDSELEGLVRQFTSVNEDGGFTISRKVDFVFVNFNFHSD